MIDTTSIFKNLQALKDHYPDDDDQSRIDQDFVRARTLIEKADWAQNPVTIELVGIARSEILRARTRLATDRTLIGKPDAQRELWFLIESREWFLEFATRDYVSEINHLNGELSRELQS